MEYKTVSQYIPLDSFKEPGNRFNLQEIIGRGTYSKVYSAIDKDSGEKVAVKIYDSIASNLLEIESEYRVLKAVGGKSHFPKLHSVYATSDVNDKNRQLWFVMEFIEGRNLCEILCNLTQEGQKLPEEQIALILKNLIEGLHHLYDNKIIHRDVRSANVIITRKGDVKIIDFGFSAVLDDVQDKVNISIGSPYWMAPEVVACEQLTTPYHWACDVWSLGITAIELADGVPPMNHIPPSRAMFRTVRNPPSTLRKPSDWSTELNDFIDECLVKNPDHRPHFVELLEHPFLTKTESEEERIRLELGRLCAKCKDHFSSEGPYPTVKDGFIKRIEGAPHVKLYADDLCNIENPTLDLIADQLQQRFLLNDIYTYAGDVLLAINPEKELPLYGEVRSSYREKTLSDNPPHLFAVADRAFEQMLHHKTSQSIILSGVSGSGKTFSARHLVDHLAFLGTATNEGMKEKIRHLCPLLDAFGSARTQINPDASRYIKCLSVSFSQAGKITGGKISAFLLETRRVTLTPPYEGNFHVFYLLYHGLKSQGNLSSYYLDLVTDFRYVPDMTEVIPQIKRYHQVRDALRILAFTHEEIEFVWRVLAAILLLGNLEFVEVDSTILVQNQQILLLVSKLLSVSSDTLNSLLCRDNCQNSERLKDSLARLLYRKIFEWIITMVNKQLLFTRLIYGDKYDITIVDPPGFEDSTESNWWKLTANSSSDYIHKIIQDTVFFKELEEYETEDISIPFVHSAEVDVSAELTEKVKNQGVLHEILHRCSCIWKSNGNWIDELQKAGTDSHITVAKNGESLTVDHTDGQVSYDARDLVTGNEENIAGFSEFLQSSSDLKVVALTSAGIVGNKDQQRPGLLSNAKELQASLPLLKCKGIEPSQIVICIRGTCPTEPKNINNNYVLHQIRCSRVLELVLIRQQGYSLQLPFSEFLNRYKFLAFDFDENIEENRENCQLLLIRLKMDGWTMGNSKVFLKYYAEEYLTHLYEINAKKVVKIQALARRFLVQARHKLKQLK